MTGLLNIFFLPSGPKRQINIYMDQRPIQNEGYLRATLAFPSWLCVNVFSFIGPSPSSSVHTYDALFENRIKIYAYST